MNTEETQAIALQGQIEGLIWALISNFHNAKLRLPLYDQISRVSKEIALLPPTSMAALRAKAVAAYFAVSDCTVLDPNHDTDFAISDLIASAAEMLSPGLKAALDAWHAEGMEAAIAA